jgi:phosphoribosylformylglycinamidine synthase I
MNTLVLSGFGTNCERETAYACERGGAPPSSVQVRHMSEIYTGALRLDDFGFVVLIGGFLDGDDLGGARAGANRFRYRPLPHGGTFLERLQGFIASGRPVLGICNGFQVLVECGLLPGALLRNDSLQFRAGWVHCRVEAPLWGLQPGAILRMPIAHGMGNYFPDPAAPRPDVVLRYCDEHGRTTPAANPNGSAGSIAGVASGNVFGLMPHPERAIAEVLGSTDGRYLFQALARDLVAA